MEPYTPDTLPLETIDWIAHISYIGKANAALARYDGILRGMVNPRILLSPLMTREAVLSSRIEGTQASLVSRQPYNVVRYISYVPHIQLEGIEHEEIHRDAN